MSRLHTRAVPWLMLACFLAVALVFFSLAAGGEALRLKGVLSLSILWGGEAGEVRRSVSREIAQEPDAPPWLQNQRQDDWREVEPAPAPRGKRARDDGETPRIVSQRLRETPAAFMASFSTSREPEDAKVYFRRNPSRWVVDLAGKWGNSQGKIADLSGYIRRVSMDPREQILRLVFECADRSAAAGPPARLERQAGGFTVVIPIPPETGGAGGRNERGANGRPGP